MNATQISPEEFYRRFVATRTPCILTNVLELPDFKCRDWTNEYMRDKAGDTLVRVERRSSVNSMYGRDAPREPMLFRDFIDHVEAGSQELYLTSQTEDYAGSELPAVYAAPLTSLRTDFVLNPPFVGNLVPYQVNVWMGNSKQGSSSGLHHDYHDNFYVLLRGYKRFNIFPPCDAPYLSMLGTIEKVHRNGLIVYDHCAGLAADGVPEDRLLDTVNLWLKCLTEARKRVRNVLKKRGEPIMDDLDCHFEDDLEAISCLLNSGEGETKEINDLVDNIYGSQSAFNEWSTDILKELLVEWVSERNSLELKLQIVNDQEEECEAEEVLFEQEEAGSDSEDDPVLAVGNKRPRNDKSQVNEEKTKVENSVEEESEIYAHFSTVPKEVLYAMEPTENSILRRHENTGKDIVENGLKQSELQLVFQRNPIWGREFMLASSSTTKGTVYVSPGECLYLPTGWMHEVTSYNLNPMKTGEEKEEKMDKGHLALNYWFHPPDRTSQAKGVPKKVNDQRSNPSSMSSKMHVLFRFPYSRPYWRLHWEKHHGKVERALEEMKTKENKGKNE